MFFVHSSDCAKFLCFFQAVVIGYEKGKGRNASVMGAVVCRMECGKTFKVGTGFTDAQRKSPPKKGSIITYRFQEYTNSGSPRFPSYVGKCGFYNVLFHNDNLSVVKGMTVPSV